MRELAILTFQSLDGVMQGVSGPDEDPSNGFTRGGWAVPYWAEVMEQVAVEAQSAPYDLLLGRTTYDMFAANWQTQSNDQPVANLMNSAKKFVVTNSRTHDISWNNSHRVTGDVVTQILELKAQSGPLLQVHGSHGLIQTLLANDLIDELRLWTFPVLLGHGKRLFGDGTTPNTMTLVRSRTTPQGVVMGIYRRHG